MHYKDGTPATLGDIVQHDNGSVGILLGGTVGQDFCSSHVVFFKNAKQSGVNPGAGYVGLLRDDKGVLQQVGSVLVQMESYAQTRELVKIGHVDIGNG